MLTVYRCDERVEKIEKSRYSIYRVLAVYIGAIFEDARGERNLAGNDVTMFEASVVVSPAPLRPSSSSYTPLTLLLALLCSALLSVVLGLRILRH